MRTILVLDDEPWNLTWFEDRFKRVAQIQFVSTHADAVDAIQQRVPDLLVLDIRIGDVDEPVDGATLSAADEGWVGLRMLDFIRKSSAWDLKRVPVFVFTAVDREQLKVIVERSYQARYFLKSDPRTFADAVEQFFRGNT